MEAHIADGWPMSLSNYNIYSPLRQHSLSQSGLPLLFPLLLLQQRGTVGIAGRKLHKGLLKELLTELLDYKTYWSNSFKKLLKEVPYGNYCEQSPNSLSKRLLEPKILEPKNL